MLFSGMAMIVSALIVSVGLVLSVWVYGSGDRADRAEAQQLWIENAAKLDLEERVAYVQGHARECLEIHAARQLEHDGEDSDVFFGRTADSALWYAITGKKNPYSTLSLKNSIVNAIVDQCYTGHFHDVYYDDVREYMLAEYGRVDVESSGTGTGSQ